jgi:transposase
VAELFNVSLGMVKKLLRQRKSLGNISPLHWRAGRLPTIFLRHREKMLEIIQTNPGTSLKEFRTALGLECSLTAIHNGLSRMGMTYKKQRIGSGHRTAKSLQKR